MNEYKGYRLKIDLNNDKGNEVVCDELDLYAGSVSEMKTLINQKLKAERKEKAPDIPALKVAYDASFIRVKITSIANKHEAWISTDGSRSKVTLNCLYADTPENENALNELRAKIKSAQQEASRLREKIPQVAKPAITEPTP